MCQRKDTTDIAFVDTISCGPPFLFSLDEDCLIDDIARNPTHSGRVPSSVWQDAVNTGAFGEKTSAQVKDRHHHLVKVMCQSKDAADIAFVEAISRGRTPLFSLDEDCCIDDIARNPTHTGRVPLSAWQDTVNTGAFGEKTTVQVRSRHHHLVKVMRQSKDAADIAFVETISRGPPFLFSLDEDCRIDDIDRNPTHTGDVPLSTWQDAVNTGAFGEKTTVQVRERNKTLFKAMRQSNDAADIAFVETRNKNTTEKRDEV